MRVNKQKLKIAMASACLNPYALCKAASIQYQTYRRLEAGKNCKTATIGKIARTLGASVTDIIELTSDDE